MKVSDLGKRKVIEFDSIFDFNNYICDTPLNETFRWEELSSVNGIESFTGTKSFDEAQELLKNGWSDMSKEITQKLNAKDIEIKPAMGYKQRLDVQGCQPIVPLYLQGVPTNMVSRKMVPIKQKVITLNKSINYSCGWSKKRIVEESIKAFMLIKNLEAKNYRCILNVAFGSKTKDGEYIVSVRIKSATEKLNISKMVFPLINPSMLRRLILRFLEVFPGVPRSFVFGYGTPIADSEMKKVFNGYLLPKEILFDVSKIKSIDDLQKNLS